MIVIMMLFLVIDDSLCRLFFVDLFVVDVMVDISNELFGLKVVIGLFIDVLILCLVLH